MTTEAMPGPPPRSRGRGRLGAIIAAALLLHAPSAFARTPPAVGKPAPDPGPAAASDPFERLNRRVYAANRAFDRWILGPVARAYARITPRPIYLAMHNVARNLGEPAVFANDILQLRPKAAGRTAVRFAFNSTFGLAGLFDPARKVGLPHHDNGFAVTMGHYGVGPGPYLFLPLIGPMTLRDMVGEGVDLASDPIAVARFKGSARLWTGLAVTEGLHERNESDDDLRRIDQMGTDSYATMRSLYLQDRQSAIDGGQVKIENLPDFGDAPATAPGETPAPAPLDQPGTPPPPPASAPSQGQP